MLAREREGERETERCTGYFKVQEEKEREREREREYVLLGINIHDLLTLCETSPRFQQSLAAPGILCGRQE